MSNPIEPSDKSKPVVKDKNPHNYRKVGYSMIVISVSLVLIGLLVWAIGDNYHFSTDIMANQEIDAMTPKHGYNLVYYDTAQPIGAKLKLLDAASTIEDAQRKQSQYFKEYTSDKAMVLIFNQTFTANQKLVQDTIDAIGKVQAANAQAIKEQEAKAAQTSASTSMNQSKPSKPEAVSTPTVSNTTAVMVQNKTQSVMPPGQSGEKLGIIANVTTSTSNVPASTPHTPVNASNTTVPNSNMTSDVNATQHQSKSVSLSESVGIKTS